MLCVLSDQGKLNFRNIAIYSSKEVISILRGIERYDLSDGMVSQASVDLPLEKFYGRNKARLKVPFEIQPEDYVLAESSLTPKITKGKFLCIETKTTEGRTGINVPGFLAGGAYTPLLTKRDRNNIMVYLMNKATVPYVIDDEHITPAQLLMTTTSAAKAKDRIKFRIGGKDVTKSVKRSYGSGALEGYALSLSPDIWCMRDDKDYKIRWSERITDAERLFEKGKIRDFDLLEYPFTLTMSVETIKTKGDGVNYAYVFPFHIRDPYLANDVVQGKCNSVDVQNAFQGARMCASSGITITGNAGLIHNGSGNTTVFENSVSPAVRFNRELLRDFFREDSEFALVVQVPLIGEVAPIENFPGHSIVHKEQKGICI